MDPLDWIDRYGADATRFTLARGSSPGGDVAISEEWVTGARNFCNKLWNATRFALLNGAGVGGAGRQAGAGLPERDGLPVPDRWILSRLAAVTAETDALFERFEFAKACDALYHFAWDEFCDWYLELAKPALTGADEETAAATRSVLGFVLDRLLRLLHPVLPFVTDELWTALTGGTSVLAAAWPGRLAGDGTNGADSTNGADGADGAESLAAFADPAAEAEVGALMRVVTEVRRFRSDQGLRPTQPVPAMLAGIETTPLAPHQARIRALLRLTVPADGFTPTASVQAEGVTVRLDTAATIDVAAERRRLEKDLAAARADADASQRKLATSSFVERAPAAVVAKSRDRLAAAQAEITRIEARLSTLPGPAQ